MDAIQKLIDRLAAGQVVEVTNLSEQERLALVYRFRRRYKKPLRMWYETELVKEINERGEPKARRRLHIYLAVREGQ